MSNEKPFLIPFIGLKLGKHEFENHIDKTFFEPYNYVDFNDIKAAVVVLLNKKSTHLEFTFSFEGHVNVPCDVTAQDFDMPLEGTLDLIVKFGEKFNEDNDKYLVIPFNEHKIDVAQYVYEMIALSIPHKRVHPGVFDGSLDCEALDYLGYTREVEESESANEEIESNKDNDTDPRWDQLKKLLTDK
ncbi:YceD family protein [Flavobacterium sp. JP2137]|uniref:YceD family protein n=1 Tax=Flavobacterium sp. JP2137 TaxID=3414510 RepID=UPI003D2FFAD5